MHLVHSKQTNACWIYFKSFISVYPFLLFGQNYNDKLGHNLEPDDKQMLRTNALVQFICF